MPFAFLRRRLMSGKEPGVIKRPIVAGTLPRREFIHRQVIRQGDRAHEPRLERENNALHESRGRRLHPVKQRNGHVTDSVHGKERVTQPICGREVDPTCQISPDHRIPLLKNYCAEDEVTTLMHESSMACNLCITFS